MVLGRKTGERWCEPRRKPGIGNIPAGIGASYHRVMQIGGITANFKNYASTLRKKLHRITNRASLRWLDLTGFGISAFLSTGIWLGFDFEDLLQHVVRCADQAVAGTLPVKFLNALQIDLPDLLPRDNGFAAHYTSALLKESTAGDHTDHHPTAKPAAHRADPDNNRCLPDGKGHHS
jgi:hypothetical protein